MYRLYLSVFGAGYSPLVPGTCGSAVVGVVFLALVLSGALPITVAVVMVFIAVASAVLTVKYGDKMIEQKGPDPSVIVSDEACGQALTYLCYLWVGQTISGATEMLVFAGAGFVLFRLFDIIKPPPVKQLEKIKGAWGVLLDDVMAGVFANIVLQILWWLGWLESIWR